MTETPDTNEQIIEQINKIYKADVESIRNLAEISEKLQKGTLSIPGNLTVEGDLNVVNNANISGKTTIKKDLITGDGAIFGSNSGRPLKISSSKYGNEQTYIGFYNGNTRSGYLLPTISDGISIVSPKLNVSGDIKTNNILVNKNITVNGDSLINKRLLTNKVRYIQVGNNLSTGSWSKDWAIAELEAFDHNGKDVALKKPVKLLKGVVMNGSNPGAITNGNIITNTWNHYFHGGGTNTQTLLEIDLGGEYYIKNIVLTSRWVIAYTERQNGTHVETLNSNKERINIVHLGNFWNDFTKHIEF